MRALAPRASLQRATADVGGLDLRCPSFTAQLVLFQQTESTALDASTPFEWPPLSGFAVHSSPPFVANLTRREL